MITTKHQTMRYSPKPMQDYGQASAVIDTAERWNLAYLSHPFETNQFHKDPHFSVHVRRTSQTRLDGGGLDLLGTHPPELLVGGLFRETAPRAVHLLHGSGVMKTVPMWAAYGPQWLHTMQSRAKGCWYDGQGLEPDPVRPDARCLEIELNLLTKARRI